MKRAALAILVLAGLTAEGQAQTPAPATSAQISAARAYGDRLIADAHAERYFGNLTDGADAKVMHLPSGMICTFKLGEASAIRIYQSQSAPGDDVSCGRNMTDGKGGPVIVLTQYATRYPVTPTVDQELSATVASIRLRDPAVKLAEGDFKEVRAIGEAPPHRSLRMEITMNGRRVFTRASSAIVRDWVISQRVTTELSIAKPADLAGEMIMAEAVDAVAHAKAPDAAAVANAQVSAGEQAADEAKRLLRTVANPTEFIDLSAGGITRIQHKASGIVCEFGRDPKLNRLESRGGGMFCATRRDFDPETFEVIYAPQTSEAQTKAAITRYVTQTLLGAERIDGFTDLKSDRAGAPGHVAERYSAPDKNRGKAFTRIAYAQVGDWSLLQRMISSLTTEKLTDDVGEKALLKAIGQAMDHMSAGAQNRPTPLAAGSR